MGSYQQELRPRAEIVYLGVAGKDGPPTQIFSNGYNCPKRVELESSYPYTCQFEL